jgi:putative DNA primase/helicase
MAEHTPIDWGGLAAALLDRAHSLVPQWLPHGVERNGRWYVGDFDGGDGESANVNLHTGQWIDNAAPDEDKGGDLISLYARVRGLNNGQAARELMRDLGWERQPQPSVKGAAGAARWPATAEETNQRAAEAGADDRPGQSGVDDASRDGVPAAPGSPTRDTRWKPIVPLPRHALPPKRFLWSYRDKAAGTWVELEAVRTWEYSFEGERFGYVGRFERVSSKTGELVKDTIPFTWCTDTTDPRGSQRWAHKTWDAPRPLYVPATLLSADLSLPVVVVEGEKCAEAGHQLLGHEFDFVSWPGGCKTWALARWGWLMGRQVILWPDADAQRQRLSKAEREAGVDPGTKPVMPLERQPGYQAMVNIGSLLLAEHGCTVRMVGMPAPGKRPVDGWDIADAIAEGWDAERVRGFLNMAGPFVAPDDAARAKARGPISTPSMAGAGSGGGEPPAGDATLVWRDKLLASGTGAIKAVRDNLVLALDGMQLMSGEWLAGVPEADGVIAFNEFTNDVVKLRDTPWGTPAGVWDEVDELEMGNWLTRVHWLPSMPRGTLEEAVAMVAKRHRFHPVRDRFDALRGTWDGDKRLATWLRRCCLEEDEWDDADRLQQYLARVGTWLVMAICARVMHPGCKFDYMTIFEGAQGVGKSTLARLLGGDYFADTGLVLGDKDSYQNLQGVLVYEWGELDSLTKTEVTKVKQFISSMKDRFRASFDRRAKDYPRQVVFIGTTNEDHYLVDPTGNRRMWPVRVTRAIDLDWFALHRDQLFAEAMTYLDAGDRFHPTTKEQRELFEPQQQQRQIENAIQAAILRYLYDENQKVGMHGENGTLVTDITAPELLGRLGISVDKQTQALLRQATAAMRHAGWVRYRSTRGDRPWMFKRPAGGQLPEPEPSTRPRQGDSPAGAGDDCPF